MNSISQKEVEAVMSSNASQATKLGVKLKFILSQY